jgi:hypothetical protein
MQIMYNSLRTEFFTNLPSNCLFLLIGPPPTVCL